MSINSNTTHRCVDCGVFAVVTMPVRVTFAKRTHDETVCGRCFLRRGVEIEQSRVVAS